MTARRDLTHHLGRAFLVQAVLIALTAILGIFAASLTVKEILVKRALEQEADHFWHQRASVPEFPEPDTSNMRGYLVPPRHASALPAGLRSLGPGFHELPRERGASQLDFSVAHVSEQSGQRLYLVFDGERVGELALLFGLFPLAVVIVVLYLGAWLAYRLSRRAISPIEQLVEKIQSVDPASASSFADTFEAAPPGAGREVIALSRALTVLARRVESLLDRERTFTRDASHELRSPLTVIRMASDIMLQRDDLGARNRASVERIQRAARDMEELTEAFLLLARESDSTASADRVDINAVVEQEVLAVGALTAGKPVSIHLDARARLAVRGSEKVIAILIGNLLRNAVKYTERGTVEIRIAPSHVEIEDSGEGMAEEDKNRAFKPFYRGATAQRGGFGVGLTIVKRLSDRFGWPLAIHSELGVGTRIRVDFPQAEVTAFTCSAPAPHVSFTSPR